MKDRVDIARYDRSRPQKGKITKTFVVHLLQAFSRGVLGVDQIRTVGTATTGRKNIFLLYREPYL